MRHDFCFLMCVITFYWMLDLFCDQISLSFFERYGTFVCLLACFSWQVLIYFGLQLDLSIAALLPHRLDDDNDDDHDDSTRMLLFSREFSLHLEEKKKGIWGFSTKCLRCLTGLFILLFQFNISQSCASYSKCSIYKSLVVVFPQLFFFS